MSNKELVKQVCKAVHTMKPQFAESLPAGLDPDKFIRNATNAIQMHPQQEKLLNADRQSLFLSLQKAAVDGLNIDGREAALTVFNTKVGGEWISKAQYMPMTLGLVKLARNSGEISTISAEVVYSNDEFIHYHDS